MSVPLLLGALLAAVCVLFVALPFLRGAGNSTTTDRFEGANEAEERRLALAEERDRTLAALKELEFDHRTGKVSDDDYRVQVGTLRRAAADALRSLDAAAADGRGVYGRSDALNLSKENPVIEPHLIEQPSIPEPYPSPAEPPQPATVPEPSPVPSEPPAPVTIPEPSPEPSPPSPE